MLTIKPKDTRIAQCVVACYLACPRKIHCVFYGLHTIISESKVCQTKIKDLEYQGDCQLFHFSRAIFGTNFFKLWEEINNWFKNYYFFEKPSFEQFTCAILFGLAVFFSANDRKFPEVSKETIESIRAKSEKSGKKFIAESYQKIACIDKGLLLNLCEASQLNGVFDKYWVKALCLFRILIEAIELEENNNYKKRGEQKRTIANKIPPFVGGKNVLDLVRDVVDK